ncbi:MAG: bifunctional nuclease family protein [Chloroflexi bacterium]|nr:bifunctional nuclease family protein [Chloroflexota bacterium]
MIRVSVDSIKVSLISQHRVVVLKEEGTERYLPIWIGPFEADAITIGLQSIEMSRPLTHDLLRSVIEGLKASIAHILVSDLRDDTFFAQIVVEVNGRRVEIDSRPSDAIALAVRVKVPIFVAESVMDKAGIVPSEEREEVTEEEEEKLAPFKDLIEGLDLKGLGEE